MQLNNEEITFSPSIAHRRSPLRISGERAGVSTVEYDELCITFHHRGGGDYTLTARSPLGIVPEHKFRPPFTYQELEPLLDRLEDSTVGLMRRVRESGPDPVMNVGRRLFYALCEGPIGAHCQQLLTQAREPGRSVCLLLVMDAPELARLPWEFLYDEARSDFVGLSMHSPLMRQWGHEPGGELEPIVPPLRILVVTADVHSQLESEEEVQTLRGLQAEFSKICELDVVSNATREEFLTALKEKYYHVLLFIGNGHQPPTSKNIVDWKELESQTLALIPTENNHSRWRHPWDLVRAEELINILRDKEDLRLVHLNGPYTEWLAAQLSRVAPATLGIRGAVTEPAYQAFSEGFYRALFSGLPLEGAVTQGRQKMDHHRAGSREWSHVVFYMQNKQGELLPQHSAEAYPITFDVRATPIEPPAPLEQEEEWKLLEMRLAIHKSNLDVLKERGTKYQGAIPAFLLHQREETEEKIDLIEAQMREFL